MKNICLYVALILFACVAGKNAAVYGQEAFMHEKYMLKSVTQGPDNEKVTDTQSFDNQSEIITYLNNKIQELQGKGFLAASVDSLGITDRNYLAVIYRGRPYRWGKINMDDIPVGVLNSANIRMTDYQDRPVSPKDLQNLCNKLLGYYDNTGFPFATVRLTEVRKERDGINARLTVNKGPFTTIDSVAIIGNANVKPSFLYNYIGIHPGDPYNESLLQQLNKKLTELPYIQMAGPWVMDFALGNNILTLNLRDRNSNQMDGIIGLQPNTDATSKFLLTYNINLALKNMLGYGEAMTATLENLQPSSPKFDVVFNWPYLLGTPIGIDGSFDLFKKDSSYVRTTFYGGFRYQFNASDYFRIYGQAVSNRLIYADTAYVIANQALPPNIDVANTGGGAEISINKTNYSLNPRSGRILVLNMLLQNRRVKANDAITGIKDASGFDYAGLYDTVKGSKSQVKITASLQQYFPVMKNTVVKLAYNGGYLSGSRLFMNELFQIGGLKLLRGFDEQSLYVNNYSIFTAELHFLTGLNSYFSLFADGGTFYSNYGSYKKQDYPISLGVGANLQNKSGIFTMAVAVGKRSGETLSFSNTKIHFGYVAYF